MPQSEEDILPSSWGVTEWKVFVNEQGFLYCAAVAVSPSDSQFNSPSRELVDALRNNAEAISLAELEEQMRFSAAYLK